MWPRRVGGLPRVGDYPARPTGAIDVSNPGQACDLLDSGRGHAASGGRRCLVPWARGAATELCACWPFGVAVCGRGVPFAASWSCMADRRSRLFFPAHHHARRRRITESGNMDTVRNDPAIVSTSLAGQGCSVAIVLYERGSALELGIAGEIFSRDWGPEFGIAWYRAAICALTPGPVRVDRGYQVHPAGGARTISAADMIVVLPGI